MFECLNEYTMELKDIIRESLTNLGQWFNDYFPVNENTREKNAWVQNPLTIDTVNVNLDRYNQDQLVKTVFQSKNLTQFWVIC